MTMFTVSIWKPSQIKDSVGGIHFSEAKSSPNSLVADKKQAEASSALTFDDSTPTKS